MERKSLRRSTAECVCMRTQWETVWLHKTNVVLLNAMSAFWGRGLYSTHPIALQKLETNHFPSLIIMGHNRTKYCKSCARFLFLNRQISIYLCNLYNAPSRYM